MKRPLWLLAVAGVALVWLGAMAGMSWLRSQRITADKIAEEVRAAHLDSLPPDQRARYIDRLAGQLNRLDFEERQKLRMRRAVEPVFEQMTDAERLAFLDRTLPQGFKQMLESINKMPREKRQRMVTRALDQMRKDAESLGPEEVKAMQDRFGDSALTQKFIEQGFDSYMKDASAETKLDLAPLIEQIQINLQGLHR